MSGSSSGLDIKVGDPRTGLITKKAIAATNVELAQLFTSVNAQSGKTVFKSAYLKTLTDKMKDFIPEAEGFLSMNPIFEGESWKKNIDDVNKLINDYKEIDLEWRQFSKFRGSCNYTLPKNILDAAAEAQKDYEKLRPLMEEVVQVCIAAADARDRIISKVEKARRAGKLEDAQAKSILQDTDAVTEEFLDQLLIAEPKRDDDKKDSGPKKGQEQKFLDALKKSNIKNPLSWADLVEIEDLDTRKKVLEAKNDLLKAIRSKEGMANVDKIFVPSNLKEALPKFYAQLELSAKITNSVLVEDPQVSVVLARPVLFGENEEARSKVIDALHVKDSPTAELIQHADCIAMMESVLAVPDPSQLTVQLGRVGTAYIFSLFLRVYCEQVYDASFAKQRHWWQTKDEIRHRMTKSLSVVMGGDKVAMTMITAFDILYRRFIRTVMLHSPDGKVQKLRDLATLLSKKFFAKGSVLLFNLFKTETKVIQRKVEVPVGKTAKTKTEVQESRKTVVHKPCILDGPKTPSESTIIATVNSALAKIETLAVDYDFESETFSSPVEWEERHSVWLQKVTQRVKIVSDVISQRKQKIRARVADARQIAVAGPSTGPQPNISELRIKPVEWTEAQTSLIREEGEEMEGDFIKALSKMVGPLPNIDAALSITEGDVLNALRGLGI